ncbi:hypothetical protein [Halosaccharopolyspora lacisalsi]|uniref:hypothetical protein n=1 Tax=Halosaccharopolyspora lacisalsi TaxID=1000566 RepID=UPI0015FA5CE6|nr:hypothetical protein [Halosaccharopolyspora lacisalsi]
MRNYLTFGNHAATAHATSNDDTHGNAVRAAVTVVTVLTELRHVDPTAADRAAARVDEVLGTDQSAYDALYSWTTDVLDGRDLTMPAGNLDTNTADTAPEPEPAGEQNPPAEPVHPWESPQPGPVSTVAAPAEPPTPAPTNAVITDTEVANALAALEQSDPETAAWIRRRYITPADQFGRNDVLAFAHRWFSGTGGNQS